jgi:peptide/nickel transport system permease protein
MVSFIARRLLIALLTLWALSVLSFVIIQLPPGDFVTTYITYLTETGSDISDAHAEHLRDLYGLNDPFHVQYWKWLRQVLVGNLGISLEWRRPVTEVIGDRLALTMVVAVAAMVFTWVLALPIGIYSALRQYSVADYVFTLIGYVGLAVPNFLLALVLMYVGFSQFDMNIGGLFSPEYATAQWSLAKAWDLTKHLPVAAVVIGLAGAARMIRIMRANLLDELHKPYVVSARARGIPESRVILRYPVRVALNPFASTLGYLFPLIVSGSIIVSIVLGLPTVGPLLLRALVAQDMFLAGAIVLLLGVMTIIGTLVSDLVLTWLDPRIRLEGQS